MDAEDAEFSNIQLHMHQLVFYYIVARWAIWRKENKQEKIEEEIRFGVDCFHYTYVKSHGKK